MSDERRAIPRADDPSVETQGAWTTIYNVSHSGMCIVTARGMQVGEGTPFRLKDRDRGEDWDLTGEVIWVQNLVSGLSRVGTHWASLDRTTEEWLKDVMRRCGEPGDAER